MKVRKIQFSQIFLIEFFNVTQPRRQILERFTSKNLVIVFKARYRGV